MLGALVSLFDRVNLKFIRSVFFDALIDTIWTPRVGDIEKFSATE